MTTWILQGAIKVAVATLTTWQTSRSLLATAIVGLTTLSSYLSQAPTQVPATQGLALDPDPTQPPAVPTAAGVPAPQHLAEMVAQTGGDNA